jgi:hypothetical protein
MGTTEIEAFLTHLAVAGKVLASTQNQAKSALLFLYRQVLGIDLPWLQNKGDRFISCSQAPSVALVLSVRTKKGDRFIYPPVRGKVSRVNQGGFVCQGWGELFCRDTRITLSNAATTAKWCSSRPRITAVT